MSRPALRLVLAAAVASLAALPLATDALAGGGKPTPPKPAGKTPAAPAEKAEKYDSLGALEAACDDAESAASKEMRRKRYDKVVAYLAANGSAGDAERATGVAMDLAEELEEWTKTVEHADAYLKGWAEGQRKVDALLTKAGAMGHLPGKKDETVKAYEAAFAAVDVEKVNPNTVFGAYVGYADWLADADDVAGAKAAYEKLKEVYTSHPAAGQISQLAEGLIKNLDAVGQEATAFPDTAKDLEGKPVTLADYKGKVLLIDFWATWCGPCRAEMPNVIKAYKRFHDKGFEVLGISLDRPGDVQKLKDYIREKAMPWRQVHYSDGQNAVADAYGVEGIPHTVLVDKDGKVLRIGLRGDALQRKLEKLFGSK